MLYEHKPKVLTIICSTDSLDPDLPPPSVSINLNELWLLSGLLCYLQGCFAYLKTFWDQQGPGLSAWPCGAKPGGAVAWGRCIQGWWWSWGAPALSSTGLPDGWHSWASFLLALFWDRVLAPHSSHGAGTCLQTHLQSESGKLPWALLWHCKARLEKKKYANYGHELSFHLQASSRLKLFFLLFNYTVGVWEDTVSHSV